MKQRRLIDMRKKKVEIKSGNALTRRSNDTMPD